MVKVSFGLLVSSFHLSCNFSGEIFFFLFDSFTNLEADEFNNRSVVFFEVSTDFFLGVKEEFLIH